MELPFRARRTLHLPITLSVVLMTLNVTLMIVWIVLFAANTWWSALIVGTVVFALILVGLSFYMFLLIKEIRLNQRQANFIDAVTHELKSPIASLKLYLETLELRELSDQQRSTFYDVMGEELERLDHLITQLLEVGRLDEIGQYSDPVDIDLEPLLRKCALAACIHHKRHEDEVMSYQFESATVHARPLVLETVFRNLLDNAVKYAGEPPRVEVLAKPTERGRVVVRVVDNGPGVAPEDRKRIFQIFFRAGNELQRRQKGTGLGLYIVHTLLKQLKGRVTVLDPGGGKSGSVFEVDLPRKTA